MTDNMTETSETSGAEQSLNTQSELDPKSVVTFVYRGENPYMRFLVNKFKENGIPSVVREVPQEKFDEYLVDPKGEDNKQSLLKSMVGPLQGVVVSDITFDNVFGRSLLIEHPKVNAYDVLNWDKGGERGVVATLRPVIEQITKSGKSPVVLQTHLGDHIRIKLGFAEREQLQPIEKEINPKLDDRVSTESAENASIYAAILKTHFNVPVISSSTFSEAFKRSIFEPDEDDDNPEVALLAKMRAASGVAQTEVKPSHVTILGLLEKMGIPPEKTVLLFDHHLDLYTRSNELKSLSKKGVEVALICPCCLVLNVDEEFGYGESGGGFGRSELSQNYFKKMEAKVFPIERPEPDSQLVDRLINMIEQKRAELAAKEAKTTPQ